MQVVVDLALDEITDIFINCLASRFHECRAKLDLCLTLKHGFFHVDGDSGNDTIADIGVLVILIKELLNRFGNMLFEGTLMRTALCGMLSVDKAMILLAILIGMGKSDLYVFSLDMYDGIERIDRHIVNQQVLQAVAALDAPPVVHDCQTRVEVGVVAEHGLHKLVME